MAQFALVDKQTYRVLNIIEAEQSFIDTLPAHQMWIENAAPGVGWIYDPQINEFYPESEPPTISWVWDRETQRFIPPIPSPIDIKSNCFIKN
jgi:hypothetical protein